MVSETGLMETRASIAADLPPPPDRLAKPALFLDLDGVLAEIAPTPSAVGPEPRRTRVLQGLERRLEGRLAVVSGRTIAEIDRITGLRLPRVSGVHGLERRNGDLALDAAPAAGVADALSAFAAFAEGRPGLIVEDKRRSAGLHYRLAPNEGPAVQALAQDLADRHGLEVQLGHMVVELKTPGADKGRAVAAFMNEPPFIGSTPVMLGDDLTDEHGFRAAAALGGFGVLVGPMRETAARYRLPDVEAVMTWLETLRIEGTP